MIYDLGKIIHKLSWIIAAIFLKMIRLQKKTTNIYEIKFHPLTWLIV